MADSCFDNTYNVGGWLKRLKSNKLNDGTQLLQGKSPAEWKQDARVMMIARLSLREKTLLVV